VDELPLVVATVWLSLATVPLDYPRVHLLDGKAYRFIIFIILNWVITLICNGSAFRGDDG
jgi:hypothetical protein